ncbi:MAG TPA: TetR/AcrR family transcriptional regulator, partial [Candidatus Binatia bacterium]|nr:TetR/AcrR family transcriptional regulator [Candidatus Binatia bacterium]
RPVSQVRKTRRRSGGEKESARPRQAEGEGATMSRREVIEEHLLEVAAKRFASAGYRQTTLDEIARHAGVAKASMYRYFENKQELLVKIFLKVASSFARGVQPLLVASLPPGEKLRRAVQDLVRNMGENIALFTVFYSEEADLPPRLRAEVLEVRRRLAANLESILREGMAQGVFREVDAKLVVYAIMGMCGWLHKWYGPGEERLEEVAAAFVSLIERGCLASRGTVEKDCLADRLRHVQDLVSALVGQAERLEQGGTPIRR